MGIRAPGTLFMCAAAHPLTSRTMRTCGLDPHRIRRDKEVLDAVSAFLDEPEGPAA